MSARTILKHLHQQGRMTDYQFDVINRNLKARPTGEWIGDIDYESYQGHYEAYKCNKCGYGLHWRDYYNSAVPKNFCPNCGADMRVKDELNNELNELKEAENE